MTAVRGDPSSAAIESYLPGRMRVRLPRDQREAESIERVVQGLEAADGVLDVASNLLSGSILLEFDPEIVGLEELIEVIRNADVALSLGAELGKGVLKIMANIDNPQISVMAHRELEHLEEWEAAHPAAGGMSLIWLVISIGLAALLAYELYPGRK